MDLHLAEIARERDLRRRRQIDVAKQNELVVEKRFVDFGEQLGRHALRESDAADLAAERRMQRLDRKWPIAARARWWFARCCVMAGSRRFCARRDHAPELHRALEQP